MMRSGDEAARKGLYYRKMRLIYAISTSVVFIFFALILSAFIQKNYMKHIDELNDKALYQSANACSTTLDNLYNYYFTDILNRSEFIEILLADGYSRELSIVFDRFSKHVLNYSNLVDSCYVVNLKSGFICSTDETYKELAAFSDQDILQWINYFQKNPITYAFVPRTIQIQTADRVTDRNYISFIYKKYNEGFMVVNLNYDTFVSMVNYQNYNRSSRTLLVGADGYVLADSAGELFGMDIKDSPYYQALWEQRDDSGIYTVTVDSSQKQVNYRRNERFGIQYMTLTDKKILVNDNALLVQTILFSCVAVLINLGTVEIASSVLYKPIGKLKMFVDYYQINENQENDEFKSIEKAVHSINHKSKEYKKTKQKHVLRRLLEDQIVHQQEEGRVIESLNEELGNMAFLVCNFYFDYSSCEKEELGLIKFAVGNILKEQLEPDFPVQFVDYGLYLTGVIGIKEGGTTARIPEIETGIHGCLEKMQEYFDLNITASVGTVVTSLFDISESYKSAVIAEFYRNRTDGKALLYFEELMFEAEAQKTYSGNLIDKIIHGIKAADKVAAKLAILQFFKEVSLYPYEEAVKNICFLDMEIIKLKLKLEIDLPGNEYELLLEMNNRSRLFELQEKCMEHSMRLIEVCQEIRENNSSRNAIVQKVYETVDENICNPDLSVNMIAQEVYLSTSYLRNIFKEVTGSTLSGYITTKRLEEICRLLRDTKLSVSEIAVQMGFSSKSYLYKFFKNYKEMTPAQYRKNIIGKTGSQPPEDEPSEAGES